MNDTIDWHRFQFAFTIIYHYLFPQLTMGLALLIAIMKGLGLRRGGEGWNDAARIVCDLRAGRPMALAP